MLVIMIWCKLRSVQGVKLCGMKNFGQFNYQWIYALMCNCSKYVAYSFALLGWVSIGLGDRVSL